MGGGCTGDYVEIHDGSSSQQYCGTSIPGPFNSTGTNITVKLHLVDSDVSGNGFLGTVCCSVNVVTDVNVGEYLVLTLVQNMCQISINCFEGSFSTCIQQTSHEGYFRNEDCRQFNSFVCEVHNKTEFLEPTEGT